MGVRPADSAAGELISLRYYSCPIVKDILYCVLNYLDEVIVYGDSKKSVI